MTPLTRGLLFAAPVSIVLWLAIGWLLTTDTATRMLTGLAALVTWQTAFLPAVVAVVLVSLWLEPRQP